MTDPTPITVSIPHPVYLAMLAEADREGTCVEDLIVDALIEKYTPTEQN